jgi:hypothetical protein
LGFSALFSGELATVLKFRWTLESAYSLMLRKTTLETSGKDVKLHSKRVEKIRNYTQNELKTYKITLETSGEDQKIHSKRVVKIRNYT